MGNKFNIFGHEVEDKSIDARTLCDRDFDGSILQKINEAYRQTLEEFPRKSKIRNLEWDAKFGEFLNSDPLMAGVMNYALRESDFRTWVPKDDINGSIGGKPKIGSKASTYANAILIYPQATKISKENEEMFQKFKDLGETLGLKFPDKPFMVTGHYMVPDKTDEYYGAKPKISPYTEIIQSKALNYQHHCDEFSFLDENGIPEAGNGKGGERAFYLELNAGIHGYKINDEGDIHLDEKKINTPENKIEKMVIVADKNSFDKKT